MSEGQRVLCYRYLVKVTGQPAPFWVSSRNALTYGDIERRAFQRIESPTLGQRIESIDTHPMNVGSK